MLLATLSSLFCSMFNATKRGFISATHGMELAIVRSVHVTWMYSVSQLTVEFSLHVSAE